MDFKKNSVEQALDDLVTKCHGGRWLKIMETKPTPLFHLFVFRGIPDHTRSYNDPEFTASQIHSWLSHLGVQLFGLQAACSKSNPGIKNLKGELDTGAGRFFAAAKMIIETCEHPAKLKDLVVTPAGATIEGLLELERCGLRAVLISAVTKAAKRTRELSPA